MAMRHSSSTLSATTSPNDVATPTRIARAATAAENGSTVPSPAKRIAPAVGW